MSPPSKDLSLKQPFVDATAINESDSSHVSSFVPPPVARSTPEFISGYVAACTSITLLFPLNKLIFRQILEGISFTHAVYQLRQEGFMNVYRGLLPPLIQKSTSYSIMFGTQSVYYRHLRNAYLLTTSTRLRSMNPRKVDIACTCLAGMGAGITEATLTPFERVQAVLQMQKYHASYRHTWHVFEDLTRMHGLRELYRGYSAICIRNSLSNSLFFAIRTPLREIFPTSKYRIENSLYDFLNGAILGSTISTIFYPLNVLKFV